MTIFELKKAETSLEDVFIDIIDNQKEITESKKENNSKDEIKKKDKKGGDK